MTAVWISRLPFIYGQTQNCPNQHCSHSLMLFLIMVSCMAVQDLLQVAFKWLSTTAINCLTYILWQMLCPLVCVLGLMYIYPLSPMNFFPGSTHLHAFSMCHIHRCSSSIAFLLRGQTWWGKHTWRAPFWQYH